MFRSRQLCCAVLLTIGLCGCGYEEHEEIVFEPIEIVEEAEEEVMYWVELPSEPLGYRKELILKPHSVPKEIWDAAVLSGEIYDLDPELLCAIAYIESRFKNVKSDNGLYWGIMQIHPGSHKRRMKRIGMDDLMVPEQNMMVAADYLHELYKQHGDITIALICYHGESGANITRYLEKGEISSYVNRVLKLTEQYKNEEVTK